jgi:hypothetical protein
MPFTFFEFHHPGMVSGKCLITIQFQLFYVNLPGLLNNCDNLLS